MSKTVATQDKLLDRFESPSGRALMSTAERLDLVGYGLQLGQAAYGNTALVVVEMIELGEEPQLRQRYDEDQLMVHVPNRELRQALSARLTKCKWTQQAIADLFGTSQRTISNDVSKSAKEDKPKQKPRGATKPEPKDAEVVTEFVCYRCEESFEWNAQRDVDGKPHCEDCALDLEEAAEHGEQAPPPPPKSSDEDKAEADRQTKIAALQEKVAALTAKTPWTPANLRAIVKNLSAVRELMDQ